MSNEEHQPLKPTGEQVTAAIRDWLDDEIKSAPGRFYDLGRFLFGVSAGTVGTVVALEKLGTPKLDLRLGAALLLFVASMLVALYMACPRDWLVSGDTDLFHEHRETVIRGQLLLIAWFTVWIVGVIVSAFAITN